MSVSHLSAPSPGICDPATAPSSAHGATAARGGYDPHGAGTAFTAAPPNRHVPAQTARTTGRSPAGAALACLPRGSRGSRDASGGGR